MRTRKSGLRRRDQAGRLKNSPMIVECRGTRILAVLTAHQVPEVDGMTAEEVLQSRGARRDPSRFILEPYRYTGRISSLTLYGSQIVARELGAAQADDVPPFPCPHHQSGHMLDGSSLAAEVGRLRRGQPTARVPVRRVEV